MMSTKTKSDYIGVSFDRRHCKWRARFQVMRDGAKAAKQLGTFPWTEEGEKLAAKAYDSMAVRFGMPTNFLKPKSLAQ